MKVFLAQQDYIVGDFAYNLKKIKTAIGVARKQGADLVIFSELAICGYPSYDFLAFDDFVSKCSDCIDQIKAEADSIAVLIGAPSRNPDREGKNLYNSAYFLYEKEVKKIIHKTFLPNYDIFDESRYFEPGKTWEVVPFKGKKLAITICEDIWDLVADPLYSAPPMDQLKAQNPDIMINLSASPFDYTHAEDRLAIAKRNVLKYGIPLFYCNAVGAQTEVIFDGGSLVMDAEANLIKQMSAFEEAFYEIEWNARGRLEAPVTRYCADLPTGLSEPATFDPERNVALIYQALVLGIRSYFSKMGFHNAIVASSGGVDSAVTLALACAALGSENVQALLLPSPFSTDHSVTDAKQLSVNLGNPFTVLPIEPVFDAAMTVLSPIFKDTLFGLAEENIQSRIRGLLTMALGNKFNYILLNTSNKSELATGYGTLYGDMAGGLGVLGDVYKMQVFALARYINREQEVIPPHIITKPPSAELRPNQMDSDSLPAYDQLDAILYQYIEKNRGPREIVAEGFPVGLVARILSMVNKNEYKRHQFCPVLRVSPKAFGRGRRMPIVGKYLST